MERNYTRTTDMSDSVLRKFAGALPWGGIFTGWSVVSSLIMSIIIVRGLGAEEYGVYALLASTMAYVAIFTGLGLPNAIHRYAPELQVKGSWHGVKRLVKQAIGFPSLLGALLLAFALIFGSTLDSLFSINLSRLLLLAVAAYIVGITAHILVGVIYASYQLRFLTLLRLASAPLLLLLTYGTLQAGGGITSLILIGALPMGTYWSALFAILVLPILMRKFVQIGKTTAQESREMVPLTRVFRYSTVFIASGVINLIVQRQSEVFFIAHYMTASDVAYYHLGYSFTQRILELMPSIIWLLGLISFTEVLYRSPDRFDTAVRTFYKFVFLIGAPISLLGFLTADKVITLIYGQEMAMAGELSRYFFLIFALAQLIFPLGIATYTLEKAWYVIPGAFFIALVNIGLSLILIPRYGLQGAVYAVLITNLVSLPVFFSVVRIFVFRRPLPLPIAYIFRCWLAAAFILPLLFFRPLMDSPVGLIGGLIIGLVLLILGMKVIGLVGEQEIEILSNSGLPLRQVAIAVLGSRRHPGGAR